MAAADNVVDPVHAVGMDSGEPGVAWAAAVGQLGGDPAAAAASGAELDRRYAEPHRRYHTLAHVVAVLGDADGLAEELGLAEHDRLVLTLAVCAHDVVYDARPGADERASAAWCRDRLAAAGLDEATVARVEALVLLTLDHRAAAGDVVAAVLLDADLAVLASPPVAYDAYVNGVRDEYAAVPDDLWHAGRGHVLRTLLDRDPLYLTAPARERWQEAARANLRRELARLDG